MESAPLNKAHQLERRAEALLRQKKFDESIEAHQSAVNYLEESLLLTEHPRAKESISLQIAYHQKKMESIRIRKDYKGDEHGSYNDNSMMLENDGGEKMFNKMNRNSVYSDLVNNHVDGSLQTKIFRTMEMHDSLIERLLKTNSTSDNDESSKSNQNSDSEDKNPTTTVTFTSDGVGRYVGKKHQVDNSTTIEEFRVLCENLRHLVQLLAVQVEIRDKRIIELEAKVQELETEKDKAQPKNNNNSLKVITDSSGGTTSPYNVFSPCSGELSPEVQPPSHQNSAHNNQDVDNNGGGSTGTPGGPPTKPDRAVSALPVFTPLEMPSFDIDNLNLKEFDPLFSSNSNKTNG